MRKCCVSFISAHAPKMFINYLGGFGMKEQTTARSFSVARMVGAELDVRCQVSSFSADLQK